MKTPNTPTLAPVQPRFDYSALSSDVAAEAKAAAKRIRGLGKKQNAAIIAIGKELTEIKDKLGHGHFTAWCQSEFEMTDRTAQRYMLVAEKFKTDNVSDLPASILHLLAAPSTPEPVRQDIIARAARGEKITRKAAQREIAVKKHRLRVVQDGRKPHWNPNTLGERIQHNAEVHHLAEANGASKAAAEVALQAGMRRFVALDLDANDPAGMARTLVDRLGHDLAARLAIEVIAIAQPRLPVMEEGKIFSWPTAEEVRTDA